ncbi:MAG: DEAD/DEAH box helicase [Firmicutes bacterium]|nr:DEAD/DEAH box helicase [Bacillota bacterium]
MDVVFGQQDQHVLAALQQGRFEPWNRMERRMRAERLSVTRGFNRLLSLQTLNLELYEHQRQAVLRVLRDMRGRALLADEVGLGKTIEAGVILKEYLVRGLVRRALILVPASLVVQWREELENRLSISCSINRHPDGWEQAGCIIASLDTARRPEHAGRVQAVAWDMVIVDEAHRLKNRHTVSWRFVDGLRKKYLLLLTATPIQNDLQELYNLLTLLKPGLLQTYSAFRREHMFDRRSPRQLGRLKSRLAEVMVRSTRRDALIRLPRRAVTAVPVQLGPEERRLYAEVVQFARDVYAASDRKRATLFPLILLLRELSSSPEAAARTLQTFGTHSRLDDRFRQTARRLAVRAEELSGRSARLTAAVDRVKALHEPAVVFTEFRASQTALARELGSLGVPVSVFHGRLNREERRNAVERFRREGGVLISTDAGSEGQNLQFCRSVVNYDLPWNPMRVEQRIGRVHRLGQAQDVLITIFVSGGTVDAHVYRLLCEKLRLFQQVIGDLDVILAQEPEGLAGTVGRIVLESADEQDLERRLADVGRRLEAARTAWERAERRNREVLDGESG